jgi:hypothetical protein
MTLTELFPAVRRLPAHEKRRLMRILAEELNSAEDISPFEPHRLYLLPTPYEAYGAGGALMAAMKQADRQDN